jgi:chromosome segregation ATPase
MYQRSRLLLLLALPALATPLAAQQKGAAGARPMSATVPAPSADVRAWISEVQRLHTRLEALQARALQDPQLSAQQQSLGSGIRDAMLKLDPDLDAALARGMELEREAAEAQRKGDQARLTELASEMQRIQGRFVSVQQRAVEQPQLAAQVKDFQTRLQQQMAKLDPQAPKLIARFAELQAKVAGAMGRQ